MKYIKKPLVTLAIISLFLFSLKWLLSFYYFPEEEITMRVISDSHEDSYLYFHYIKSLADFDFNTGEFRIETWINFPSFSSDTKAIFAQGGYGSVTDYSGYSFFVAGNNKLYFYSSIDLFFQIYPQLV